MKNNLYKVALILLLCHFYYCNDNNKQYNALVDFYNNLNGNDWINNWDISNNNYCDYYGIFCDNSDNIIGISLSNNNLCGTITNSLIILSDLNNLDLSNNRVYGEVILGKINSITLSYNEITLIQIDFCNNCILNNNNINSFNISNNPSYLNLDNNYIDYFNYYTDYLNMISLRDNVFISLHTINSNLDITSSIIDNANITIPYKFKQLNASFTTINNMQIYYAGSVNYWTSKYNYCNTNENIANISFSNINNLQINNSLIYNSCYCNSIPNCYYDSCQFHSQDCNFFRIINVINTTITNNFKYINKAVHNENKLNYYYGLTTRLNLNNSIINSFILDLIGTIEIFAPNSIINYANITGSINTHTVYGYNYQYDIYTTNTNITTCIFDNSYINNMVIMCGKICSFKNIIANDMQIYYLYNNPNDQYNNIDFSYSDINYNNVTTFSYQNGEKNSYYLENPHYTYINYYVSTFSNGNKLCIFSTIYNLNISNSNFNYLNLTQPINIPTYYSNFITKHDLSYCNITTLIYYNTFAIQFIFDNSNIEYGVFNILENKILYKNSNITFFNTNIKYFLGEINIEYIFFNNFTGKNTTFSSTVTNILDITNSIIDYNEINITSPSNITINNITSIDNFINNNCGNISIIELYGVNLNIINKCSKYKYNKLFLDTIFTNSINIIHDGEIAIYKTNTEQIYLYGNITNLSLTTNSLNVIINNPYYETQALIISNSIIKNIVININSAIININNSIIEHIHSTIYSKVLNISKLKITPNNFLKLSNTLEIYGYNITLDTDVSILNNFNSNIKSVSLQNCGLHGVLPVTNIPFIDLQYNNILWNNLYSEINPQSVDIHYINKYYKNDTLILQSDLGNIVFITKFL